MVLTRAEAEEEAMPSIKIPPEYIWEQDGEVHILALNARPVARVAPEGAGWIARTVLISTDLAPQMAAVRSLELGKGWAARWVALRHRPIARLCGREDLVPPVPRRRIKRAYQWGRKASA